MSDNIDFSSLFSSLNSNNKSSIEEMITTLMSSSSSTSSDNKNFDNISNTQSDNNDSTNKKNTSSSEMPDMKMILKLMEIFKTSNENNPSKELLKSLKPFLNDDRKEKVDQYIKILGITRAFEIFNELGDKPK